MWRIGIKSGIITVLGQVIYGLLVQTLGWQHPLWKGMEYVVFSLGIYSGHCYYKAANKGLMTYQKGLKLGLIVSSFTGLTNGIILYLYTKYANPLFIDQLRQSTKEVLRQGGTNSPAIEKAIQSLHYITPEILLLWNFIGAVFVGLILTFFVSLLSRKTKKYMSSEKTAK